jgi:hypothetical protein
MRAALLILALAGCGCPHPSPSDGPVARPPMDPLKGAGAALLMSIIPANLAMKEAETVGVCIALRTWSAIAGELGGALLAGRCAPPVTVVLEACAGMPGEPSDGVAQVAEMVDRLAVLWEGTMAGPAAQILPPLRSAITATATAAAGGDLAPVWPGTCGE